MTIHYVRVEVETKTLRSQDDGLDVGEIAKQYGGGGHKHASGFRVPYGHELAR